ADMSRETPVYSATAAVSGFDIRRWLGNTSVSGVVGGTVEARGNGFALGAISATTRMQIQSAEAQGWKVGDVAVEGHLQKSIASIDGQLKSAMGGANWSGKISIADKRPSYDLNLAVQDLDLQKVSQSGQAINGKLNLRASVNGSGSNFADMNMRADEQVLPSSIATVAVNQGSIRFSLIERRVRIARAVLSTRESMLSAAGEFGLVAKMSGNLDYRLRIGDVAPWLTLLSRKGSGGVEIAGRAQGSL